MKEGSADAIRWVENIITVIVLEQTRGGTECVQNIAAGTLRAKVMEGNTVEDIFSYMPTEEIIIMALVNIGIGDRVQDTYNSRQRYTLFSLRRLCEYINVMQGATTQDR